MKLPILIVATLLGEAASAYQLGDKATGMTDPNVTRNCSRWANKIASGDTCEKLESDFNLDFLQLHEWNPSLVKDPCNPIQGWSYCVDSPSKTNSLARNVGTDAPVLKNPYLSSTEPSTAPASATTASTATANTDNTASTTGIAPSDATSTATSTTTSSSSAQQTGGSSALSSARIPVAVLSVALSALVMGSI